MEDIALVALVTPFVVGAIQALKFLNLPYRLWRPSALFVGVGLALALYLESPAPVSILAVAGAVLVGVEAGLAAWGTYDIGKNMAKSLKILSGELDT